MTCGHDLFDGDQPQSITYQSVNANRRVRLFLGKPLLVCEAEQQAAFAH